MKLVKNIVAVKAFKHQGGLTKDKRPATWITSLVTCTFSFLIGLPYATNKGNIYLDGIDFFLGIAFLLFVCFVESLVLNFEFGWTRLEYALQKATLGKRTLLPHYQCCRFDFHLAIPVATFGLFLYQMVDVIRSPYLLDHPQVETAGWVFFGLALALTFVGLWKREEGQLAILPVPLEDYPWGVDYWAEVKVLPANEARVDTAADGELVDKAADEEGVEQAVEEVAVQQEVVE